jgi:hypothetical protein
MILMQCIECGFKANEFPSRDYTPDANLEFTCPECGFEDKLLAGQSVADYATEFDLKTEEAG